MASCGTLYRRRKRTATETSLRRVGDVDPEIADGEDRLEALESFLAEELAGALQPVHEGQDEHHLAAQLADRLGGFERRGALRDHVFQDHDARARREVAFDQFLAAVLLRLVADPEAFHLP